MERYKALVFTVCLRHLGDREEAEDLAQESFLKAHVALSSLRRPERFKSWLLRIAAHACLKKLRARPDGELRLDGGEGAENALLRHAEERLRAGDPEGISRRRADLAALVAGLRKLGADYRQALVLRYFARLSYKEIAEIASASLATIKFRIHHGTRLLRAHCIED